MHFYKGERLFNGHGFSKDNAVLVTEKGAVLDFVDEDSIDPLKVQRLKGIITPGFVNTHCHTELSHLKNKIPQRTGLPEFGKNVISLRNSVSDEEIREHIAEADKEMWENGIVAVGDICNDDKSFDVKAESEIYYHTFIELMGLNPERAEESFKSGLALLHKSAEKGLQGSLAPHAPYSASKELIKMISRLNAKKDLPGSIHNQESEEETRFFMGEKNGFNDLYNFLKIDIGWFKAPGTGSLAHYYAVLEDQRTILVHNTYTSKNDVDLLDDKDISWCFCPNANLYIENKLPDFNIFSPEKNKICLGTDSLASNISLDILSEANVLLNSHVFGLEDILRALTSAGADALGISKNYGAFVKGKNTGINLVEFKDDKLKLVKKLG